MATETLAPILKTIRQFAEPISGEPADFSPLLAAVGDAQYVLIGEATHGTDEFYRIRAELTRRLIREKGFHAVAVEADWPDAYRANRYVRGSGPDRSAEEALGDFRRFPTWMWRNRPVAEFLDWMRAHNAALPPGSPGVGFYGLDLYGLRRSTEVVIEYLERVDPEAAARARRRYACFDHFDGNLQSYGYGAGFGLSPTCESEVVEQLREVLERRFHDSPAGIEAEEALFHAEQSARLVKSAEEYYRTMFRGRVASWNLRDQHMVETLGYLVRHLKGVTRRPKVVLWAHNSHLGDARATEMGDQGEWNVGELLRRRERENCFLIGFTTHEGTVTAASNWDGPMRIQRVRPSMAGSYEALFHQSHMAQFWLNLRDAGRLRLALGEARPERAIGVIYRPDTERQSHYFHARMPEQFDAVIHLDETTAVEPLDRASVWRGGEVPETYPSAV